jgi:hypothetical protein
MDDRGQSGRRGQTTTTSTKQRHLVVSHAVEDAVATAIARNGSFNHGIDTNAVVLLGAGGRAIPPGCCRAHWTWRPVLQRPSWWRMGLPPNGEEGTSTDDSGSGGDDGGGSSSGKDDGDDDNSDHAGASVVGSICGVDHGRTFGGCRKEIMNNFLHVGSLVVSIPHIIASDRVFSRVRQN